MGVPNSPIADVEPPAERRNLPYAGTCTERGKPVGLPVVTATRESEPQGEPKGLRVGDGGKSECLPVAGRIGVEPGSCTVSATKGYITPRESGQTSNPGRSSRESLANHFQEGKQMTAVATLAGAPSSVTKVHAVAPSVYREVAIVPLSQRVLPGGLFERPELDDAKVSRPVPRGLGASDGPRLPDPSLKKKVI